MNDIRESIKAIFTPLVEMNIPQPGDWVILVWDANAEGMMGKLLTYFIAKDESGAESATSGLVADALENELGGSFDIEDFELERMSYEDLQNSGYIDAANPNKIELGQGLTWN